MCICVVLITIMQECSEGELTFEQFKSYYCKFFPGGIQTLQVILRDAVVVSVDQGIRTHLSS